MKVKVLVIIVLLALAAVVGFGIYKNQPQNVAIDALVGVSDEFLARDEITPIVKMFKSGSLYFGFGKTQDDNGESVTENFGAYGKIYFSEDAVALENIDILYDGFWVYGDAYISKDLLFMQEEKILNNAAYGTNRNNLALSFENSIFAFGSGSKYAIADESAYNAIMRVLNAVEDTTLEQDAEALLAKIIPEIWTIVCDNCEITSGDSNLTLQGEKVPVRIVRMVFDTHSIQNIAEDIYYYLKSSGDIIAFIRQHEAALSLLLGLPEDTTAIEAYNEFLDEYEKELDYDCKNLLSSIDKKLELKIVTPKLQSKLLMLEIAKDDEAFLMWDFGKDGLAKTNKITFKSYDSTLDYIIEQNDDDAYESQLYMNGRSVLQVTIDKKRERFEVGFGADSNNRTTAKGVYKESSNWSSIQLDKIVYSSDSMYEDNHTIKCNITLILQQNDTFPTISGSYTPLSAITEEEVDAWVQKSNL